MFGFGTLETIGNDLKWLSGNIAIVLGVVLLSILIIVFAVMAVKG